MSAKLIKWQACGEDNRERVGTIRGFNLGVHVDYLAGSQRYSVRFGGQQRGDFDDVDAAKKFAEKNITAWIDEVRHTREEEAQRREEEKREHLAMTRMLETIVSRFANHGIPCRAMGGIFLRIDVAEKIAGMLDDLRRLEERGAV